MATVFAWGLSTELSMNSMNRDPGAWGIGITQETLKSGKTRERLVSTLGLPIHHKVTVTRTHTYLAQLKALVSGFEILTETFDLPLVFPLPPCSAALRGSSERLKSS